MSAISFIEFGRAKVRNMGGNAGEYNTNTDDTDRTDIHGFFTPLLVFDRWSLPIKRPSPTTDSQTLHIRVVGEESVD